MCFKKVFVVTESISEKLNTFCMPIAQFCARLYVANVFFQAGLLKVGDFGNTLFLFEYEYQVPLLPFELAAYMATAGELVLPILLVFGLFGRFASLGLLVMTLVIELLVYPGTVEHYYWMLLLGLLFSGGVGKLSVDYFLWPRIKKYLGA
ncbi:MAG: DoxX family protein [Alphaproteobacteria bacterium]|nr:DoxX family protein [Alphaproteobacteria bacterium]MDD9919387.1 DoxX family protein [Alphaproteobacteria bacterium]